MAKGFFEDITAPYGAVDAWFYDRIVAPAVAGMFEAGSGETVAAIPRGGDVLDVGCGGGHELGIVAERRPDLRLTGIDLNDGQVERARRRLGHFGERVELRQGSALDLPFDDDRFDFVMSSGSIKHWPDPAQGLRECVRVLRPGGRLVVLEADRACRHEDALAFVSNWRGPGFTRPFHLMLFRTWVAGRSLDRDELAAFASDLPLDDVRIDCPEGTPAVRLEGVRRAPA